MSECWPIALIALFGGVTLGLVLVIVLMMTLVAAEVIERGRKLREMRAERGHDV